MARKLIYCALSALLALGACVAQDRSPRQALINELVTITDTVPGTVGIAFVSSTDTITLNNGVRYPMMSVFKLHQALAVSEYLQQTNADLDSALTVTASEIDTATWSPMLKDFSSSGFDISIGKLIDYSLTVSDNNASNILFGRCVSPLLTDSLVKNMAADTTFQILYSEGEMKRDHSLSLANYTSPLSAAILIRQLFTEQLVNPENQEMIKSLLANVTTGQDRLGAALPADGAVFLAHKTGSGYRTPAGELIAHNDVGYFRLPDGRDYALAVMIRNYAGTEAEASAIMARISRIFLHYMQSPR